MKSFLFCLLTACFVLSLGAAPQFAPKPESPRSFKFEKRSIPMMEKGKVRFALYVPKTAPKSVQLAAREMAELLSRTCGISIKAVTRLPADKKLTLLRVGDKTFAAELKIDLSKLDRDGFVIAAKANQILIAGSDAVSADAGTGTLFAVYDFLERFADARFYFPGKHGTLLPVKKQWSVPAMTLFDRPDSQFRDTYWKPSEKTKFYWYDASVKQAPAESSHRKRLRLSTLDLPNCHGLAYMGYVQRFAKTHPEYFALKPDGSRADGSFVRVRSDATGHPCFSSGIMEEIYQDAKAILTGPEAIAKRNMTGSSRWYTQTKPFFNLMPNDSMARCFCKKCAPYFKGHAHASGYTKAGADFLWRQLLTIPNRLKKEKIPGFVTMMAYDLCKRVPDQEIPDNVVLQVALSGPWKERKPAAKALDDQILKEWVQKIGSKVYLWNYVSKFAIRNVPAAPNFTPKSVGAYYKETFPYSFGAFMEAESDGWFFGHLNYYVFAKVMWDHTTDVDALLKEYRERMFGKAAAAPLKQIMDLLEDLWLDKVAGNAVETAEGPVFTPPSEYKLWNTIYSPKRVKQINALFDKAEKLAAADKEALERVRMVRRCLWGPANDAAADYFRKAAAVDYWRASAGEVKQGETIQIDGKGSEKAWETASQIALIPLQKDEAEVKTFVKLLYDKENLYFLFDCREPFTAKMRQTKRPAEHPDMWADNAVEIHLDTDGKRQQAYQIIVDSYGKITDLHYVPGKMKLDYKWNGQIQAKTSVVPGKGWFAEIKVPLKHLAPAPKGKIMVNFNRHRLINDMRVHPYYTWSPFVRSFGDLANFGVLYLGPLPEKNLYTDTGFSVTAIKGHKGSSWTNWGALPARDHKIFRSAGVSIRLEAENKRHALLHKLPDLKPDTTYRLSFFIRQENVKPFPGEQPRYCGFYVRIDDGNGVVRTYPSLPYYGSIPWTRWEYTFTTGSKKPATKYTPYHHFILRKSSGKVWIDHAELVELPSKK